MPRRRWLGADARAALLLAVLALGLRLHNLGKEPVWVDEAYTWHAAQLGWWSIATLPEQTPPLYNLIMKAWVLLAGDSPAALRLPAALFGAASVGIVYLVARRTGLEPRGARLAAALVGLNFYMVRYAQTARTYTLFVLLACVSYLLMPRVADLARERGEARPTGSGLRFGGYVVATALLLYAHAYALLVVAAQATTVGTQWWLARRTGAATARTQADALPRRSALGLGLAALPFLAWLPIFLARAAAVQEHFWILPIGRRTITHLVTAMAGVGLGGMWDRVAAVAFVVLLALGMARLWHQRRQADRRDHLATLVPWLAFPILPPLLLSLVVQPFFTFTYSMAAWPAAAILVAHAVYAKRWNLTRKLVALALLGLVAASAVHAVTSPQNQDWATTVRLLDKAEPGDLVLFSLGYCGDASESMQCPWEYHHGRDDLRLAAFLTGYRKVADADMPALDAILANETFRTVWVVHADDGDPGQRIAARLGDDHRLGEAHDLRRIRVERWDPV